ncbi:MAG: RNA polymerase sigma factor [Firmicutes bacterium]|nr:RNA polymerase sigma factor [Bacillota bacterium]
MESDSFLIEELYEKYHKDVYRFAYFFTNSKLDAEDITQEVFIKVLKNLYQLRDRSKEKTWIITIVRNTAVDHIRRQRLIRFLPQSMLNDHHFSTESISNELLIVKETRKELRNALMKLQPNYRSVVILRALHELSVKETAEALKCSEGKVRVDFHRALIVLKNIINLKEEWIDVEKSR